MPGEQNIEAYQKRLSNLERDLAKSFERVKELEVERDSLRSSLSAPIETVRSKLSNALAQNVSLRADLSLANILAKSLNGNRIALEKELEQLETREKEARELLMAAHRNTQEWRHRRNEWLKGKP